MSYGVKHFNFFVYQILEKFCMLRKLLGIDWYIVYFAFS